MQIPKFSLFLTIRSYSLSFHTDCDWFKWKPNIRLRTKPRFELYFEWFSTYMCLEKYANYKVY